MAARDPVPLVLLVLAGYNALELLIYLGDIFTRRNGLYFWSITVSIIALVGYTIIGILGYCRAASPAAVQVGSILTVSVVTTAHAFTMYSRLRLFLRPQSATGIGNLLVLPWVLWLIITTTFASLLPEIVVIIRIYISGYEYSHGGVEHIIESVCFTIYCAREVIICSIYILQGLRQLQPIAQAKGAAGKRVIVQLILVQAIAILLDLLLLLHIYLSIGEARISPLLKGSMATLVYALQIKMEFFILNRLVVLLEAPITAFSLLPGENDVLDISPAVNGRNP
ncbi:hypothetical protein BJX64DRAFT_290597 [Aspergillus heterothallicus]